MTLIGDVQKAGWGYMKKFFVLDCVLEMELRYIITLSCIVLLRLHVLAGDIIRYENMGAAIAECINRNDPLLKVRWICCRYWICHFQLSCFAVVDNSQVNSNVLLYCMNALCCFAGETIERDSTELRVAEHANCNDVQWWGDDVLLVCDIQFCNFVLCWWWVMFKIMLTVFCFAWFCIQAEKCRKMNCVKVMASKKLRVWRLQYPSPFIPNHRTQVVSESDVTWCIVVVWVDCCQFGRCAFHCLFSPVPKQWNSVQTCDFYFMTVSPVYCSFTWRWVERFTAWGVSNFACCVILLK